jgi:molybdate transport system permease protein
MNADFAQTLLLTGKLALETTLLLVVIGFPIAYALAYRRFWLKPLVEALISMPMVLPPTVLGYYLLLAYNPQHVLGHCWEALFDRRLAFQYDGVLLASVLFGLPFMVQPLQNGFTALPPALREASATLGKSTLVTFFRVLVPNMWPSVVTAVAMTFAHCIGEFGVVLMVGGNIPGETRVASIALYDEVQALHYDTAGRYSLVLFGLSLLLLTLLYAFNHKSIFHAERTH